jgi:hypothetical protein
MASRTVFWQTDLGDPAVPKPYRLQDGSYVFVSSKDIARAHQLGFNPQVYLAEETAGSTAQSSRVHEYQIVGIRPSDTVNRTFSTAPE